MLPDERLTIFSAALDERAGHFGALRPVIPRRLPLCVLVFSPNRSTGKQGGIAKLKRVAS
jgi:hypothetical protein